MQSMYHKLLTV